MPRFPHIVLAVLLCAAMPCHAAGLPDTGQDTCYNETVADGVLPTNLDSIARDDRSYPRQDCRYGRDAAAVAGMITKTGGGASGFDYTKIANNGSTLPAGAALGTANTAWACTRDNITGLIWEVKTAASTDLRFSGHTYTWFDSTGSTNGGNVGSQGIDTCKATLTSNLCNTQAYAAAVNAAQLCTYSDWRLPTRRELLTLANLGGLTTLSISPSYFPNTIASNFWSGSSYVPNPSNAWIVTSGNGYITAFNKLNYFYVQLVRGGQF